MLRIISIQVLDSRTLMRIMVPIRNSSNSSYSKTTIQSTQMIQPLALLKPSQTRNMLQILEMLVPASTPIETRGNHQTRLLTL